MSGSPGGGESGAALDDARTADAADGVELDSPSRRVCFSPAAPEEHEVERYDKTGTRGLDDFAWDGRLRTYVEEYNLTELTNLLTEADDEALAERRFPDNREGNYRTRPPHRRTAPAVIIRRLPAQPPRCHSLLQMRTPGVSSSATSPSSPSPTSATAPRPLWSACRRRSAGRSRTRGGYSWRRSSS